jgi:hypothetical protein
VSFAQHPAVELNSQLHQLVALWRGYGLVSVLVKQVLVSIHLRFGLMAAGNAPKRSIVEAVQG